MKTAPHHVVLRLAVTGGFLAGAHLEFADGLNCLIGGRGAGKTTALEFLRFGLGLMPDPKTNSQRPRARPRRRVAYLHCMAIPSWIFMGGEHYLHK